MNKLPKLLLLCLGFALLPALGRCQDKPSPRFLRLTLENKVIGPVTEAYIADGIAKAQKEGFSGIILVMDTPGGLLETTRNIVKTILNSNVPFITYIAPSGSRAGSAGVFITYASHIAAMAHSTNIGAAHPVTLEQGEQPDSSLKKAVDELTHAIKNQGLPQQKKTGSKEAPAEPGAISDNTMENKILNDTIAWIETIARSRNRNAEWAKTAVLSSASVAEKEALDKKIVDIVAADIPDLLRQIDGKTVTLPQKAVTLSTKGALVVPYNMTLRQDILNTIIHPNIAYILMLGGFLGLFIEITHPGVIFPGILGIICLIVAFYAFAVLPVNYAGFLLIGLAVTFFVAEAFLPASFGLLTAAGVISILIGSLMLVPSSFLGMKISLSVILPFTLAFAAIVVFLMANVIKTHRRKVATGAEALVGEIGTAQGDIPANGAGQAFVAGELWTAINESPAPIANGDLVKILKIDKVKLVVTKYVPNKEAA